MNVGRDWTDLDEKIFEKVGDNAPGREAFVLVETTLSQLQTLG
jgi:hypothetical protein